MAEFDKGQKVPSELFDTVTASDAVLAEKSYDLSRLGKVMPAGARLIVAMQDELQSTAVPIMEALPSLSELISISDLFTGDARVAELESLLEREGVKRLLVLLDTDSEMVEEIEKDLELKGIQVVCMNADAGGATGSDAAGKDSSVSNDDYFSEEDSEAAAQRLRELGYL